MADPVLHLLYQDDNLLGVSKPAGLLTVADGYDPELPHLRGMLQLQYGRVWIVHRLDRYASGVLLVARSAEAHRALNRQFEQRQVKKTYHAIVEGTPRWEQWLINLPLRVNGDRRHRTVLDGRRGKTAETSVTCISRYPAHALVECQPRTGYLHQIRAHLAGSGLPILADELYNQRYQGKRKATAADSQSANPPLLRLALHALRIEVHHPLTHQPLVIEAPYPDDFIWMIHQVSSGALI